MPNPTEYTNNSNVCEERAYTNCCMLVYNTSLVVRNYANPAESGFATVYPTQTMYNCDTSEELMAYIADKGLDWSLFSESTTPPPAEES